MEFKINDKGETIHNIARKIGYFPQNNLEDNSQYSLVREISKGSRYPRFHIYLKKDLSPTNFEEKTKKRRQKSKPASKLVGDEKSKWLVFNLHLDQKNPSYKGSPAHSGEYVSPVVENEAERIKNILKDCAENKIYKF